MTVSNDYLYLLLIALVFIPLWFFCAWLSNKRRLLVAREGSENQVSNNNLPYASSSELPVNMLYWVPTRVQRVGFFINESAQNARELNHFAQSESNMLTTTVANSIISSSQSSGRNILAGHVLTESEAEDIHINPVYTPDARVTQRNRFITYLSTLPIPINFVSPDETLVTGEPITMRNIDEECINLYGRATYYATPPSVPRTGSRENVAEMASAQTTESEKDSQEEEELEEEQESHSSQLISRQEPECMQITDAENDNVKSSVECAESNVFIHYDNNYDDDDTASAQSIMSSDKKNVCNESIV